MKRTGLFLFLGLAITGCATAAKSTFVHTQGTQTAVENEIVVKKPFDEVWDKLVGELSKSFFVINNIEKASRIINVSFSVDAPQDYIDCGRSTREYKGKKFDYAIAEDSYFETERQIQVNQYAELKVNRDTKLEGRTNIYVAPEGEFTKVSVNTRYIFSVTSDLALI